MLAHVIVTVSDFTRSIAFYAQALKPLGITDFLDYKGQDGHPDLKGFGNDGRFFFWLKEGEAQSGCRSLRFCRQKPCGGECLLCSCNCSGRTGEKLHRPPSSNIILTITRPGYSTPTVTTLRL